MFRLTIAKRPSLALSSTKQLSSLRLFSSSKSVANKDPSDAELDDIVSRIKITPIKREHESLDKMRSRLIYQSRKRGILETDLLLSGFAAKYLKHMTEAQLKEYDTLLHELDWDIYYWATKNYETKPLPDRWKNSEVLKMLQSTENKEKKIMRMPELEEFK